MMMRYILFIMTCFTWLDLQAKGLNRGKITQYIGKSFAGKNLEKIIPHGEKIRAGIFMLGVARKMYAHMKKTKIHLKGKKSKAQKSKSKKK